MGGMGQRYLVRCQLQVRRWRNSELLPPVLPLTAGCAARAMARCRHRPRWGDRGGGWGWYEGAAGVVALHGVEGPQDPPPRKASVVKVSGVQHVPTRCQTCRPSTPPAALGLADRPGRRWGPQGRYSPGKLLL